MSDTCPLRRQGLTSVCNTLMLYTNCMRDILRQIFVSAHVLAAQVHIFEKRTLFSQSDFLFKIETICPRIHSSISWVSVPLSVFNLYIPMGQCLINISDVDPFCPIISPRYLFAGMHLEEVPLSFAGIKYFRQSTIPPLINPVSRSDVKHFLVLQS